MSFGYSVGDIVLLGQLAWNAYRSCRDAPESFKNISQEVLSLHALLKETEENLSAQTLSSASQARLKVVGDGCRDVLEELQSLVDKYESLGTQSKRTWDRVKWGSADIAELRSRLVSNSVLLTAFISTTQVVVEKKLDKFLQEYQDGQREGSVITTQTVESLSADEKQTWRIIRKELEDIGITVAAFDANSDFILNWFKTAIATGVFEEQAPEDNLSDRTPSHTGDLDTMAETQRMQVTQKAPARKGRVSRVAGLIAWVFRYDTELINAAQQGQGAVVQWLLEKGADVNAKDSSRQTALLLAISNGHTAVVKLLLERGADIHAKDRNEWTVLHWAAWKGDKAVVKLLLERGADINAKGNGWTALHWAAWEGGEAVVKLLLERGVDINAKDKNESTALHWAVWKGDEAVVKLLLERGADINAKDRNEWTVLHWAAWKGGKAVVKLLLERGADINAKGKNESTALHWAAKGDEAVVKLLLERGADINAKGKNESTALHWAAKKGDEAVVKLLLERGADINAKDRNEWTALHIAARWGYEAVVKLLLETGADINAKSRSGLTAFELAVVYRQNTVAQMLKDFSKTAAVAQASRRK